MTRCTWSSNSPTSSAYRCSVNWPKTRPSRYKIMSSNDQNACAREVARTQILSFISACAHTHAHTAFCGFQLNGAVLRLPSRPVVPFPVCLPPTRPPRTPSPKWRRNSYRFRTSRFSTANCSRVSTPATPRFFFITVIAANSSWVSTPATPRFFFYYCCCSQ